MGGKTFVSIEMTRKDDPTIRWSQLMTEKSVLAGRMAITAPSVDKG